MLRCLQGPRRCLASADFVAAQSVLRLLLAQLSLPTVPPVLAQEVAVPTSRASSARRCYASENWLRPSTELVAPWTTDILTTVFQWVRRKGNPGMDYIDMELAGMIEWMFS